MRAAPWGSRDYGTGAPLIAYRKSWFADVGASQPPKPLEEYKKIGAALKQKGNPIGQILGHTSGDAPAWTYPFTWSFGRELAEATDGCPRREVSAAGLDVPG